VGTIVATVRPDAGVLLDITFATSVTAIRLSRLDPSGFTTLIRAGDPVTLVAGHALVYDYEAPLDVEVSYNATQVTPPGSETAASNTVTVAQGEKYSWLKDPGTPSRNLRVPVTTSIEDLTASARAGTFDIINRASPVVVSAMRKAPQGQIVVHTNTDTERQYMWELMRRGQVLLFQTPAKYAWGSQYIHVGDVVEARVGLAMEPARRWTLPFTIVDRPAGLATAPPGTSWTDVKGAYTAWGTMPTPAVGTLAASNKRWNQLPRGE
jgi:hypothetical protein